VIKASLIFMNNRSFVSRVTMPKTGNYSKMQGYAIGYPCLKLNWGGNIN